MSSVLLPVLQSQAAPSALCNICPEPGRCCKRFAVYSNGDQEQTFWKDNWREDVKSEAVKRGFPFEPLEIRETYLDGESGEEYVTVFLTCPKLTPAGRCSIYSARPALCKSFQPASNALCVFGMPNV